MSACHLALNYTHYFESKMVRVFYDRKFEKFPDNCFLGNYFWCIIVR